MDTEQENNHSSDGTIKSPTLDTLCHDLDMFISELNEPKIELFQLNNNSVRKTRNKENYNLFTFIIGGSRRILFSSVGRLYKVQYNRQTYQPK